MAISRTEILQRVRAEVAAGRPVVGCGAGAGISAKSAEAGGADLIIIYNSGRYRMAGRGSLAGLMPYGDANGIVVEMAAEVLPVVTNTPVLAGVCGTDPFRLMPVFLKQLREMGFFGHPELPDGWADRRHFPERPGSHRYGIRQRGRSESAKHTCWICSPPRTSLTSGRR